MEETNQNHLQPLLLKTTRHTTVYGPSSSPSTAGDASTTVKALFYHHHINNINLILSNSDIYFRLVLIIFIGVISVWANYEASKGFDITISKNHASDSLTGKRFALFYVSNDRISQLVISTSKFVEGILYPNETYTKKKVNHIIIQLSSTNLAGPVTVHTQKDHEFVLTISPSVMEESDFRDAMFLAVQQGMARIWLWDGQGKAPPSLINGMVKYLTVLALSNKISSLNGADLSLPRSESRISESLYWKDRDAGTVARFLKHCDDHNNQGRLVRGLNQVLKDGWQDHMLDDALSIAAQHLCASPGSTTSQN